VHAANSNEPDDLSTVGDPTVYLCHATPEEIPAYDAVRLFIDRARAALLSFRLDAVTAGPVAEVCRHLDGIPLALELAAARVKTLTIGEIAARLDDRFQLLTAGPRTAEARQRTLRAMVQWSHQLLTEPQQVLFRRLSVFRGGWSADAAERVCAGGGIDRSEVVALLADLVDRSLVVADHREAVRFRMLETLRHYAAERLAQADEDGPVARAHAIFFIEVAERGEPQLRGPQQGRWLGWLATEQDNLRVALGWCRAHAGSEPDLQTLLQRGQVPGPCVLAGHSFGGLYVLTFAARYPDEVAGMVLIDSTAPASGVPGVASPGDRTSCDVTGRVSALASSSARLGLGRLFATLAASGLPPRSRDEVSARMATASSLRSTIDEYLQASAAGQAAALTDFADKPLVVLTAGSGRDAASTAAQNHLATLSTNSVHRVIAGATLASLIAEQRDAAATTRAVLDVVSSVRSGEPLAR
jgi:pimeloyl-ACP methyl ester carboxylesterase